MTVLVDTSVWSLALRRRSRRLSGEEELVRDELAELIREGRAQMIGPVRQEVLAGIRDRSQYERLRRDLRAFDDPRLVVEDYEEAARASNECRAAGVGGSAVDFLICAVALRRNWPVFTTDKDFARYASHLPLRLHQPRPKA
ncbi:MAG TPA: PIN domain-containing protein [Terriglobia bacterium]|nr:PIN domain-containing protein [Terriglobia bacterium]